MSTQQIAADASDHVIEARQRARQVLGGEAHLGAVDDWRRALVSARDSVILVWLVWAALLGFGLPAIAGLAMVVLTLAAALLTGISLGRATQAQVQYYAAELERERREIREDFDHEREEVLALYAAKGLTDPLLTQVVDTLCADEDRLLKVMMEEELGLSMHHVNHPIVVGAWNFLAAAAGGLLLAIPAAAFGPDFARGWVPAACCGCLVMLAIASAKATRRSMIEFLAVGLFMAVVTGGVAYALGQWLSAYASAA